ncbi:MAG: hypothetical protein GY742_08950, partial [Hyphomicrobiales bacterium]|nr:hypothetical protein [Hyphomicrobiales bacterium]
AAGFYAVSYKITDGSSVDGLDTNDVIISYRGTDDPLGEASGADIWNGWIGALGWPTGQAALAFDFFEAVTGADAFDGVDQGTALTGHSSGGGLAGLVGSISGDNAIIFDNMPYAQPATVYALAHAAEVAGQSIASLFGDTVPDDFIWPAADNITNIYLEGEALYYGRIVAHANWPGISINSYIGLVAAAAVESNALAMELQETTIELDNHLGLIEFVSPVNLHSQQLKPIMMFGDALTQTDWHEIVTDLYAAWFDKELAETVVGSDGVKLSGTADPASKLRYLLAYSALDEGTLVFGNTGIRAMFDDANELGKLVTDDRVPSALEDAIPGITQTIVQFAGQMALREVRYQDHEDRKPEEGLLGLNTEETVLKLDLAKELWNLGGEDPDADLEIMGIQTILDSFFGKSPELTPGPGPQPEDLSELIAAMELLYGSSETSIVDRIDFALGDGDLTLTLEERGENTGSYDAGTVGIFAAIDGDDTVTGNSDNNIIVGGEGDDTLTGGLGSDIIIGGLGSDTFVDMFAEKDDSGNRVNEDDVYIGEPSQKALLTQFNEWLRGNQPADVVEYRLFDSNNPDAALLPKGLVVEGLELVEGRELTSLGDVDAVKFTLKDENSGASGTDYLINIDKVQLSERSDRMAVATEWLDTPILIDMAGSDRDEDFLYNVDVADYSALTTGLNFYYGETSEREQGILHSGSTIHNIGAPWLGEVALATGIGSDAHNLVVENADKIILTGNDD